MKKNEGESMIPKWKKSKLVGGKKNISVLPKQQNKQRRKFQITINGADRDFTSLC